jgi:hypothetical protein
VKEQCPWGKTKGSVTIIIRFIVGKVGDVGEEEKKTVSGGNCSSNGQTVSVK